MLQSTDTYLRELIGDMTKVFISYSHDSDEHRDFVRGIADRLRNDGVDCLIDQYINGFPPEGWQRWMENQIEEADFVLLVCTETYLQRYRGQETDGGKGVNFESMVISQTLYDHYYQNTKFIPTIPEDGNPDHVPVPLKAYSTYRLNTQYDDVYRILTGQTEYEQPALGEIRQLPAESAQPSRRIYSDDLPTVEGKLFGRTDELALLDQALNDDTTHIVQFVASGGTGKTKLIRTWLDENDARIEGLIAWSFYSQGSGEDKQISATPFFMQALKSLGSDKSVSDFHTEEEKGEYIADLLREKRCLLVLDGLEPLQQVGRGMRGELKDRAIRKMLRCLVGDHSSLCIITTRLPVHELKSRRQVVQHDLQNLAPEDGVALLRSFGVSGRDVDMLAAVEEYGRHALALHLLGNALATYLDGDVRKRDTLTELIGDYDDVERHAFKVMQAYEHWLEGTPELKLLYLLGLFDHPVKQDVLEVLWDAEIPGLTKGVEKKAWLVARRNLLEKLKMMSSHEIPSVSPLTKGSTLQNDSALTGGSPPLQKGEQGGFGSGNIFDCHPLIREYFGRQLKDSQGEVWRQAHTVLYEYYKGLPDKYLPDTLEEMQPLFLAVAHGCNAELYDEVLHDLYWPRLRHSRKQYLTGALGAFGDDLMLISYFFKKPWTALVQDISEVDQLYFLAAAGHDLCSLGRVTEAVTPAILATDSYSDNLINSAISVLNLSEIQLISGEIELAIESTEKGIYLAKRNFSFLWLVFALSRHAKALTKAGKLQKSLKVLKKARLVCFLRFWDIPQITFGRQGIAFYEGLLSQNKLEKITRMAKRAITLAENGNRLTEIGSYQLIIGRSHLLIIGRSHLLQKNIREAAFWIKQAVTNLRASATLNEVVGGLIIFSTLLREQCKFADGTQNLQEIYEIAKPSGMRLHLTDYHLEMARLILAVEADPTQYPEATPDRKQRTLPFADQEEPGILTLEGHIAEAARLIEETGYHRRDAELAELQQALEKP